MCAARRYGLTVQLGAEVGTICVEDDDEGESEPDEGEVVEVYE